MIARAYLIVVAVALLATGVGFCGVAIYLLLATLVSVPAAAALTALILFLTTGAAAAIYVAATRQAANSSPSPATAPLRSPEALVAALTQLAKEHPLLAVICAAALGLSDSITSKRR